MLRPTFFFCSLMFCLTVMFAGQSIAAASCDTTAGMADAYVLALSWHPAFCETHGYEASYPECLTLPDTSYQARHLVLHGLWPNQNGCGIDYEYCGVEAQKNYCDYPPLALTPEVGQKLMRLMPSYAHGSCLERHEWYKHGSCQLLSTNQYYALALRLTREASLSPLGQFLHQHSGKFVSRAELLAAVKRAFGQSHAGKIYLGCQDGMLVDVYIQLPAVIPFEEPLKSLVRKAPAFKKQNRCPKRILISDFTSNFLKQAA